MSILKKFINKRREIKHLKYLDKYPETIKSITDGFAERIAYQDTVDGLFFEEFDNDLFDL